MSNKWIKCKYLIFHCFILFLVVNSQQENQPMKQEDDEGIWVELEMEAPARKIIPLNENANQKMDCVQKECRGNNASMNGNNTKCSLVECAFPFEKGDDVENENLAWLLPIPFRRDEHPRQCTNQKEVDPNEVFLEFEFCYRRNNDFGTDTSGNCYGGGYLICYEGKLDPERVETIFSLKNSNTTGDLIKLCDGPTPRENFGKIGGLAQGLSNWENNKGIGPKHGFMVGQSDIGGFEFTATFLPTGKQFSVLIVNCLRIRIFNEPHKFPIAKITFHDENGNEVKYDFERKIPENITEKLANGEPLNGEELLGYWLLGLDMFGNFRTNEPYNLKIVKKGNEKCVPTGVVRSTHFALPKQPIPTNGGTNEIEMEQWELANADTVLAEFGGRVQFNDDESVVVNYGAGEDWLNMTFAVPSADSFLLKQPMISVANQQKQGNENEEEEDDEERGKCWKGESEYQTWQANNLLFEYNQLGANCQIFLGRTELISHLEMPSSNINLEIDDLELNEVANIGIDGITLKYSNNAKLDHQKMLPIKMECAVKNQAIMEFSEYPVLGSSQPNIFQINFLPFSLNKFGNPLCKDVLQIIFDSQYELLLPKKVN